MFYRRPFLILLICGMTTGLDLASGKDVSRFQINLTLGAIVAACLIGVIEKKLENMLRRKWGDSLCPPEYAKLIVPPAKQLTPLMWGIFGFGHVAGILWILFGEGVGIGLSILFLTYWALMVMVITRALNGKYSNLHIDPPAEEPATPEPERTP